MNDAARYGRIGGLTAWSRNNPETMVGPAHAGFRRRFEKLVDPEGILDPIERTIRATRARRAHMLPLAARSAAARRKVEAPREEAGLEAVPVPGAPDRIPATPERRAP